MSEPVRLDLDEVRTLVVETFLAHGASPDQARAVADTVTAAERDECKSHGLFRVPGYIASIRSGKIDPSAIPAVEPLAPAVVKVDGFNGLAPLALEVGREPLVELARAHGIAALAVTNTHHFAALWPETEALAEQGLVGFAFVAAMAYVAPAGGTRPLYGTNPMAFAWPREGREPLVFDQASAASARGEIMLHQRDGKPIPEGWGVDAEGKPTTDPAAVLAGGAQLPFGGYKGASIALMIELLAGALVGDLLSFEASEVDNDDGGPPRGGELLLAIDPVRCSSSGDGVRRAERLFSRILEQEGTRLPSDRRYAARRRTPVEGVLVPANLYARLQDLRSG